jgi:hypothetical protein
MIGANDEGFNDEGVNDEGVNDEGVDDTGRCGVTTGTSTGKRTPSGGDGGSCVVDWKPDMNVVGVPSALPTTVTTASGSRGALGCPDDVSFNIDRTRVAPSIARAGVSMVFW